MREEILAYGHPNITAKHRSTMQLTKETDISVRADCIIGVRANKSVYDMSDPLKTHLLEGGEVEISLTVNGLSFSLRARGDSRLVFSNKLDSVIRRSNYIDDRTLAVEATAAAKDIPRDLVKELRDPRTILIVEILF